MRIGAQLEDAGDNVPLTYDRARFFNHFHNPLKVNAQAGLTDILKSLKGQSTVLWANSGEYQNTVIEGDWSWQRTRDYFYKALTSQLASQREENFARVFRGLGHQMHLLQDMAVPAHVRNDSHPLDSKVKRNGLFGELYFEPWAKENARRIREFAANPDNVTITIDTSKTSLLPISAFYDTDRYDGTNPSADLTQGLAEYTNANFFSHDTVFSSGLAPADGHYFPYPRESGTNLQYYEKMGLLPEAYTDDDGIHVIGFWIAKQGEGETINHFAKPYYAAREVMDILGEGHKEYQRLFYLDEKCHEDYAEKLVPKAVGYSTALLEYFFRGDAYISESGTEEGYVIENFTEEDMDGIFEVYYDREDGERVKLWSGDMQIEGWGRSEPFMFSVPADAETPCKYMLVFRGRLGNEGGAVFGKELDMKAFADCSCSAVFAQWRKENLFEKETAMPCGKMPLGISTYKDAWDNQWTCKEQDLKITNFGCLEKIEEGVAVLQYGYNDLYGMYQHGTSPKYINGTEQTCDQIRASVLQADGTYLRYSYIQMAPYMYYCAGMFDPHRIPEGVMPVYGDQTYGLFRKGGAITGMSITSCDQLLSGLNVPRFTAEQTWTMKFPQREGCITLTESRKITDFAMENDGSLEFTVEYWREKETFIYGGFFIPPTIEWGWEIQRDNGVTDYGYGICDGAWFSPRQYSSETYSMVLEHSTEHYLCRAGTLSKVN